MKLIEKQQQLNLKKKKLISILEVVLNTERHILLGKINSIYPQILKLSKAQHFNALLYCINLNTLLPDPQNRRIAFAVQEYIIKTEQFSKHYEKTCSPSISFFLFFSFYLYVMSLAHFLFSDPTIPSYLSCDPTTHPPSPYMLKKN